MAPEPCFRCGDPVLRQDRALCSDCVERDKWLIFGLIVAGLSVGAVLGWLVWNWTGGHPGVSFVAAMFGFGTTYLGTAIAIHKFGPDQAQRNRKGEG